MEATTPDYGNTDGRDDRVDANQIPASITPELVDPLLPNMWGVARSASNSATRTGNPLVGEAPIISLPIEDYDSGKSVKAR